MRLRWKGFVHNFRLEAEALSWIVGRYGRKGFYDYSCGVPGSASRGTKDDKFIDCRSSLPTF